MHKTKHLIILLLASSFIISVIAYSHVPDRLASHWDAAGNVNGHMSKLWGLFFIPFLSIALVALFYFLPKIDPLKKNIEKFKKHYETFILILIIFLFYTHLLTLWWNLGHRFNIIQALVPAFGLLIYYIGVLFENVQQNWFIGIRTPWTMSNKKVWTKTHLFGSKLFKIAGILSLLGIIFYQYAFWLLIVPVIIVSISTLVYSYLAYKKEK
jgi:uncharacterized membrane protein